MFSQQDITKETFFSKNHPKNDEGKNLKKPLYEIKASGPHLSFNIFGYTLTRHTTKNKLYKTLDLRSRDTLNLDILKKGLGIVSWLHFVDDFSREMFLMLYILLSDQLWLSRCLYLLRY